MNACGAFSLRRVACGAGRPAALQMGRSERAAGGLRRCGGEGDSEMCGLEGNVAVLLFGQFYRFPF